MADELPRFFPDLCALIWPVSCLGCGAPDRECCARRFSTLIAAVTEAQSGQGCSTGAGAGSGTVLDVLFHRSLVTAYSLPYVGLISRLLVGFKHAGRTSYVPLLTRVLTPALQRVVAQVSDSDPLALGTRPPLLIPLPSTPRKVRARGYDHLTLLGRHTLSRNPSAFPGVSLVPKLLRTLPGRTGQVGLRAGAREQNAARIAVRPGALAALHQRPVILFDDIVTTGASMRAACDLLEQVGVSVVGAVALCAVFRAEPKQHETTRNSSWFSQ